MKNVMLFLGSFLISTETLFVGANAQSSILLAVPDVPCKGIAYDAGQMGNLIRMELGKTGIYTVIGTNEMEQTLKKAGFALKDCYSRTCLMEAAKLLQAGAVFSGSVDRYGEKIVFTMQILDAATGVPQKSQVVEFYNAQQYIDQMSETAVKKLLGLETDKYMEATLMIPKYIILNRYSKVLARGPRMGLTYLTGNYGRRMSDKFSTGGYNMIPLISVFGYQYEEQYMSAGDIQGLVDVFAFAAGIESGLFIPGGAVITGLRHHASGFEFGIGPAAWFYRGTKGFFDDGKINPAYPDRWYSVFDDSAGAAYYNANQLTVSLKTLPDKRGEVRMDFSLLYSVGKTFHFGSVDIPVNLYMITAKKDFIFTLITGFNVKKQTRKEEKL